MATRPTDDFVWATDSITEPVSGLPNKTAPTPELAASGLIGNENLGRQHYNYLLNNLAGWVAHLDERHSTGDFVLADSSETATTINARLGGTWSDKGTDTIAGEAVRLFKKTA